jgi:hypothetical protein
MSQAQLYADVHVTIALWRRSGIAAAVIRQQLGIPTFPRRPRWREVRTFMLGWLAGREALSLQRVG